MADRGWYLILKESRSRPDFKTKMMEEVGKFQLKRENYVLSGLRFTIAIYRLRDLRGKAQEEKRRRSRFFLED